MVMPVPSLEQEQNGENAFSNQIFSLGIHTGRIDLVFMINGDKVRQMTTMAKGKPK
jgi:hypothetical protein